MKLTMKSILTAATSFAMCAALAVPVMAEGSTDSGKKEIGTTTTKFDVIVKTDGNTYAPNTSFDFEVEPLTKEEIKSINLQGLKLDGAQYTPKDGMLKAYVKANEADKLPITISSATFTPSEENGPQGTYKAQSTIAIESEKFTEPGFYVFKFIQKFGGNTIESHNGIELDERTVEGSATPMHLVVYITRDNGVSKYKGVYLMDDTKKNDTIINHYGDDDPNNPDENKPHNTTHDLTINKIVTGNMIYNKDQKYNFTINIEGAKGELYKAVTTIDGVTTNAVFKTGDNSISLGMDDSVKIYGLSNEALLTNDLQNGGEADIVTITEENLEDYTQTLVEDPTGFSGKKVDFDTDLSVSGNVTADGANMTVENNIQASAPTGIFLDLAPYIAMLAIAGVFGYMFINKKSHIEE